MRLTEITYDSAQPVEGYGAGFFRIGGRVLRGPVLITPWDAGLWGGLEDTGSPMSLAGRIDVLLLGMGSTLAHPPAAFRAVFDDAGIGLEVMASPTACRSYNVLLSEGRRIALAALPVA